MNSLLWIELSLAALIALLWPIQRARDWALAGLGGLLATLSLLCIASWQIFSIAYHQSGQQSLTSAIWVLAGSLIALSLGRIEREPATKDITADSMLVLGLGAILLGIWIGPPATPPLFSSPLATLLAVAGVVTFALGYAATIAANIHSSAQKQWLWPLATLPGLLAFALNHISEAKLWFPLVEGDGSYLFLELQRPELSSPQRLLAHASAEDYFLWAALLTVALSLAASLLSFLKGKSFAVLLLGVVASAVSAALLFQAQVIDSTDSIAQSLQYAAIEPHHLTLQPSPPTAPRLSANHIAFVAFFFWSIGITSIAAFHNARSSTKPKIDPIGASLFWIALAFFLYASHSWTGRLVTDPRVLALLALCLFAGATNFLFTQRPRWTWLATFSPPLIFALLSVLFFSYLSNHNLLLPGFR